MSSLVKLLDDRALDWWDAVDVLGFAQEFERFRNVLPLVDHRIVAGLGAGNSAERFGQSSVARVLASALRISAGRRPGE